MINRDFSPSTYEQYLSALQKRAYRFLLFRDFISDQNVPGKICLVRHDVDRKPGNALAMAQLEQQMGIVATYYFRYKPAVFDTSIIRQIQQMGHEVGYHYENLSDTDGNHEEALVDFEKNLVEFRKAADVKTISMHGRPFKPYDNRDLWGSNDQRQLLKDKFNLLGEIYLDIDYKNIAYINDTGRNWHGNRNNIRDYTNSEIETNFETGEELLRYLSGAPADKIVLQVHPERWDQNFIPWLQQYFFDLAINMAKKGMMFTKRAK